MSEPVHVLDASAILALLLDEPGAARIAIFMIDARVSAVNLSEVVAKLAEHGVPDADVDHDIATLRLLIVPFDAAQATSAGRLRRRTRAAGLSLGDRACLALAHAIGGVAVTTDRAWSSVDCGVTIEVVAR